MTVRYTLMSLAVVASLSAGAANPEERPNIILFLVDDMGWEDTSLPFWSERTRYNDMFETPNMERLAAEGMMFTQAYASSVSSPSRCSLMTGANAARHRVTNWTLRRNVPTDNPDTLLSYPDWNVNGISPVDGVERTYHATALPELLRRAGYVTIHCGKAHFGAIGTPAENPLNIGFDVNIAGHAAGGPASYLGLDNFGHDSLGNPKSLFAVPGLEDYWGKDIFLTDALTREAIKALDEAEEEGKPFFLYMSHYAVHVPIDIDRRYYQKYIDRGVPDKDAAYCALVEGMDTSLGELMDWLEASGQEDNTIILFMSDNGGLAVSSYWRDGEPHTQNYPLRSGKGSAYEGGVREPMIVKWPGRVEPGSRCSGYLLIEDFFPSILEMAGIDDYSVVQEVDGRSFVPYLINNIGDSKRVLVWNFPNRWDADGPGIAATCTIRRGDWKLIYFYADGHKELYNIKEDIGEQHDLSDSRPRLVNKLSSLLGRKLRAMKAQRPSFKSTGEPCPWPDEV